MHHKEKHQQITKSTRQRDQNPERTHQIASRECRRSARLQGVQQLCQSGDGGE